MHTELQAVIDCIGTGLLGKKKVAKVEVTRGLARRHVLIEDLPSKGKTRQQSGCALDGLYCLVCVVPAKRGDPKDIGKIPQAYMKPVADA